MPMDIEQNILTKKASITEYQQLRALFLEIRYEEFSWLNKKDLQPTDFDDSTQGELIFTAYVHQQLVGFISIGEQEKFVHNLFVAKQFRKLGVASALIATAIKKVGLPLSLGCMKANTNALNFYLAKNWRIKKEAVNLEGSYYIMQYCQ